jgi:flagellar assembly protein FliH
MEAAIAKHHEEVARALHEFAGERKDYYHRIEGEVVALALAIARKILHREVQIDPQALAGIVRVTLEKLDNGTKVDVRVHPREATDWRHYFACQMGDAPAPEVHEDAALAPGECRIETSMGSTDVGLETQLKEIETGLLDLLAERPGADGGPAPLLAPGAVRKD